LWSTASKSRKQMNLFPSRVFPSTNAMSGVELPTASQELARPMPKRGNPVHLAAEVRRTLEQWVRSGMTPQRLVLRSRIVLLLAGGMSAREAARALKITRHTVDLWRKRFEGGGCQALVGDKAGRGRKRGTR
jgi:hypothetical protein